MCMTDGRGRLRCLRAMVAALCLAAGAVAAQGTDDRAAPADLAPAPPVAREPQASVLGQVNRPGRYAIGPTELRLSELLAMAGGIAPGGSDQVVLTGRRQGQAVRLVIDLPGLFGPGGRDKDVVVLEGDAVWVDRQAVVYVYGEVQRPGALRLERGMTLLQVLATGGGLTARGTDKGVRVHRKGADGKVRVLQVAPDEPVQEGDVVLVRESVF